MALYIFHFIYFIYFNEFLFCYVLHFLHTDPYEHVGKIQKKKEKKTKHIYIANSHTITLMKKKERKKHTPLHSSLFT